MANPLLAPTPFDPRGGFGFQRPPIGDPYAFQREFDQPIISNGGVDIPLVGGHVCLPGTYCDGPHIRGPFGTSLCYGECLPVAPGINGQPLVPLDPQVPGVTRPPSPAPCNGACASGYHLNKSDYFLKNGTFIRKGTACVKNRRRNPLNPRAADRAIGRLRSASAFGKYLAKITLPGRGTKRR